MNQSRYGSKPPHVGRSIIALSALLTLATACGLFQPAVADLEPSVAGVQVIDASARQQQTNFQLAASIPGVTPSASSVQVSFTTAMNQVSVQQSINIYSGSYSEAANPATFQKLQLTSICNGQWRVRNPNAQAISFQWDIYNTTEKGVGIAIPSGDTFLQTTTGSNTFRLFVANVSQAVKATNPAACSNSSNLYSFVWTNAQTVQVTPAAALQSGKAYTLAVSTAAKNLSGTRELSAPYSSGFTALLGGGRESGVLAPGGTFVNSDGVRIVSPIEATDKTINVWIERVDPTSVLPLPSEFTLIGGMYRVGATERVISKKRAFTVVLPVPVNLPSSNVTVALLSLVNDASIYSDVAPTYKLIWIDSYDKVDLSQRLASITQDTLTPKGSVFALAFLPQSNTSTQSQPQAVRAMEAPLFEIICDASLGLSADCQCPVGQTCNQTLLTTIADVKATTNTSYTDFEQIFGASPKLKSIRFAPRTIRACQGAIAAYSAFERQICVCLTRSGTLDQSSVPETLRHETFHALQAAFIDLTNDDLRPARRWIIEATASASEKSTSSQMNTTSFRTTAVVFRSVLDNREETDAYRFQDFWVFTGRVINQGLAYLKPVFQTGLNDPVVDVSASLPYNGGFQKAYVDWARNQGAEKTLMFRTDMGLLCTISPTISGTIELTFNFELQPIIQAPQDFERLSSRAFRLTFANRDPQNIRLTLSANNPSVAFKIYRVKSTNSNKLLNCPDDGGLTSQVQAGQTISVSSTDALVAFISNPAAVTSSVQIQVERIGTLDLDDGTLDGNQLQIIGNASSTDANNDGIEDSRLATDALRLLPTDFTGGDADGNGKAGNGRVDMADFRRLRDLLLRSEGLGANVASSNPKLNLGAGSSVLALADFNGSGRLGFNERKAVSDLETGGFVATGFNINSGAALLSSSGANLTSSAFSLGVQPVTVTRDAQGLPLLSDFEVFYNTLLKTPALWTDPNYTVAQLPGLLNSGDLEIWSRDLFGYPGVASVRSIIDNESTVLARVYTPSSPRQVYTLSGGSHVLRLVAGGNIIIGLKKPFGLDASGDVLFGAATTLTATLKTTYDSSIDDCTRLQGVYSFDAKGLFDGAVPQIGTSDSFMSVDGNDTGVREQRVINNWPLQLESKSLPHCNIPVGQRVLGWDLNAGYFNPGDATSFYVSAFRPVLIQDNRWPGLVWNSTDLDDPLTPNASVPLQITITSSLTSEATQVVRGLPAGNAARALLKPALEAAYRVVALDDDTNPNTNFSLTANNVNIPYGTNLKITYRGRFEWHHQIFCSVPLRCTSSGAGLQRMTSDSRSISLTAPIAVTAPVQSRPRF